jgi:hypothetical protein
LPAIATGTGPQLQQTLDPKKVTLLQKGEVVRCYKRGGLTRQGQYQVLMAITGKAIFFKSQSRSNTLRMTEGVWDAVLSALRATNEGDLFSRPREYKVPHSASDGTDIYVSFRKGGKTVRWDNVRFDPPEKGIRLLTLLENIEFGRAP